MNYRFEQRDRRPVGGVAMALGLGLAVLGLMYGAPGYFTAVTALSAIMAGAALARNSHSGLALEGDTLTLFKDQWRHVIHTGTIRGVRVTRWSEGQADVWLDVDRTPPCRLPGLCLGSAAELTDALRKRGIAVR